MGQGWPWWHTVAILILRKQNQYQSKFKPAWETLRDSVERGGMRKKRNEEKEG